jgi:hypothetical protein
MDLAEILRNQQQSIPVPRPLPQRDPTALELLHEAWNRLDPRALVLVGAAGCVLAHRQKAYGPPEDNFTNIARLWNAYLMAKGTEDAEGNYDVGQLGSVDVAIFEILVKVARLAETPDHLDSWTDIAGYAACGARCANASPGTPTRP